jgi:hypothetical protein
MKPQMESNISSPVVIGIDIGKEDRASFGAGRRLKSAGAWRIPERARAVAGRAPLPSSLIARNLQ